MDSKLLEKSTQFLNSFDENSYFFFDKNQSENVEQQLKESMKEINDLLINNVKNRPPRAQELFIKNFDEEQIWAQINSNCELLTSKCQSQINDLLKNKSTFTLIKGQKPKAVKAHEEEEEEDEEEELEDYDEEELEGDDDDEINDEDLGDIEGDELEGGDDGDGYDDLYGDDDDGEDDIEDKGKWEDEQGEHQLRLLDENYKQVDIDRAIDELEEMEEGDFAEDDEEDGEEDLYGEYDGEEDDGEDDEDDEGEDGDIKLNNKEKKSLAKFLGAGAKEEDDDDDFDEANFEDDYEDEDGDGGDVEEDDKAIDDSKFKKKAKKQLFDDAEVEDDVFANARETLLGDGVIEEDEDDDELDTKRGQNKPTNENESRIQDEIQRLEDKIIAEKSWQTKGEIKSFERPKNSLLEETLDFDMQRKSQPDPITPQYTASIEAMIKQRVLDEAWDDPIRYSHKKPIKETFSNLAELNFEKDSRGLAGQVEDEYKTDVMKIQTAKPEDDLKTEIGQLFKKLSYNLDVLSNFSFTPKVSTDPAKIVANVDSIRLEEKTPLAFSTKKQMAPHELLDPKKVQLKTDEEKTHEDRKHDRNAKKRNIRQRNKEKHKKQLIKNLENKGQSKHEYNLMKKGLSKYKQLVDKKNQSSVKFTKSQQFFENMEKDKKQPKVSAKEKIQQAISKGKSFKL